MCDRYNRPVSQIAVLAAFKFSVGIAFTHGIQLCGSVGRLSGAKTMLPRCISDTMRCIVFILGGDIG